MEFTKENIIKLLKDQQDFLKGRSDFYKLEKEKGGVMEDYYDGKQAAFESSANVMSDTIDLIERFFCTTEDLIDKENR